MKVFDGYRIYVQVKDIFLLQQLGYLLPSETYRTIYAKNSNHIKNDDFVSFNTTSSIAYFKGVNWILNAKIYLNKSLPEIYREIKKVERRLEAFKSNLAKNNLDDSSINEYILTNQHKLNQLQLFYAIKDHGYSLVMPPEVASAIKSQK